MELIKINDKFSLGKYPVTNVEYKKFVDETGYRKPSFWDDNKFNHPNQPVTGVSWVDANEFCKWANLRLPTENEWEYACRAGTTTDYYFGDDQSKLGDYAWFYDNSNGVTHLVGEKLPNDFGLYDIHGNVWEWCQDWYDKDETYRVLRGGSWFSFRRVCRSAVCFFVRPGSYGDFIGFRAARSTL